MDVMQIGLAMILVPVVFAVSFVVGRLLYLIYKETIKAWRDRNVAMFLAMLLVWSFVIGTALALVGSV